MDDEDSASNDFDADLEGGNFDFGGSDAMESAPTIHDRVFRTVERTNLWLKTRWAIFIVLLFGFTCRVVVHHGFYIIAYGYGIYFLNLSLGFVSPLADPELDDVEGDSNERDDYRPFVRRLPEFKYWFFSCQYLCLSLFLTCFEIFNLPVFWPILVGYFFLLVFVTLKDRVKHMIRYGYVPWSSAKKKYGLPTSQKEASI